MCQKFTPGVPLLVSVITKFITSMLKQDVRSYPDQLRLRFMLWIRECKITEVVPQVYLVTDGNMIRMYRADNGHLIYQNWSMVDPLHGEVNYMASFGVEIINAWYGERPGGSGFGWWHTPPGQLKDVPTFLSPFPLPMLTSMVIHPEESIK
jgi:hypothetical protein